MLGEAEDVAGNYESLVLVLFWVTFTDLDELFDRSWDPVLICFLDQSDLR